MLSLLLTKPPAGWSFSAMAYVDPIDLLEVASKQEIFDVASDDRSETVDQFDISRSDRVQAACDRGEAVVNSYIGSVYELPIPENEVTPALKDAVLVLAKYKLFARRNYIDDSLQREYKATISWLEKIRKGEIELFGPSGEEIEEGGDRWRTRSGFARADAATTGNVVFQT